MNNSQNQTLDCKSDLLEIKKEHENKGNRRFNIKKIILMVCITALMMPISGAWAGRIKGKVSPQGLRTKDNILVYLTKTPGFSPDAAKTQFVVDQNNLTFLPHVLVIPVGATVGFPNNDKVDHNVFSLSRTKSFNFGSYKPGQSPKVTFDKPGIVELRCDLHAEMLAYILVMKGPYYALTDKNGEFEITANGLEPGKYTVKTWHEKLKSGRVRIELPAAETSNLSIKLKRGAPGVLYK